MFDFSTNGPIVPARMLNEFSYCPRLGYLEWVQGEWAENPDTLDGEFVHRNVDREHKKKVPTAEEQEKDPEHFHTRSLRLEDETLGLVAVVDVLEVDGMVTTPVDYKKGKAPDDYIGVWDADKIQLCAQGLLLMAAGYTCHGGEVYYAGSKKRVPVEFSLELIDHTKYQALLFRETAEAGKIPPPLVDSPKCPRCSLVSLCLPDETNLLQLGIPHTKPGEEAEPEKIRQLITPRDDAKPLYVVEPGSYIRKSDDRLVMELKGQKLSEARLTNISHLCLFGGIVITEPAMAELMDREIPVCHFTMGGWFRGITLGFSHKNVELRIQQFATAADPEKALKLAQYFVAGKIRNCRTLLRRNSEPEQTATLADLADAANEAEKATSISTLMGIEGMAAKRYFASFPAMLKKEMGFTFDGRNRRPPTDPTNAMLSFLYAMLTKEITVAAQAAGLDPMLGFLHSPRYGRPSLALDLAEEFRPILADSVLLSLVNTGEVKPEHFVKRSLGVALTTFGRKAVIGALERRINSDVTHPVFGYVVSYRRALMVQARLLGRYLLGEIPDYPAFKTR